MPAAKATKKADEACEVLVVDDDADDLAMLVQALERCGASPIATARDGEQALEVLRACRALPKLVLLDINMPKLRGTEVVRSMRAQARTRRVPVMMVSGSAAESDVAESYDAGANGYIVKPARLEALEAALAATAAFWLKLNQVAPAFGSRA